MRDKVLVYCDYGCSDLTGLCEQLKAYFGTGGIKTELVDAASIIKDDALDKNTLAFFMPGGAATPYRQKLEKCGNEKIADYVKQGGVYFGICAGAYYACEKLLFEEDIPEMRIIDECGLNLINAHAVGTLYKELGIAPYSKSSTSATVTKVLWNEDNQEHHVYYHGGPFFDIKEETDCEVLAQYSDVHNTPPAIVLKPFGDGLVIASGVHMEDTGANLKKIIHRLQTDKMRAADNAELLEKHEASRQLLFNKLMQKIKSR